MTEAYLARVTTAGKTVSLFYNRVMFPIISTSGDVIAFGGRVMDDSKPKYLNSSDTPAFKKSKNLFALNFAKSVGSDTMILCEGYMDVISLHGAGFTNAVATLGTAITPEQARVFSNYTKNVIICYDSDNAGQTAAAKAFRLLGETGVECKILTMRDAKDPDEFIKKFGAPAFKNLLENSVSEYDYRFSRVIAENDINTSEGKLKAIDEVEKIISSVHSAARRDVYISDAAKFFGVSPESIRNDVSYLIKKKEKAEKAESSRQLYVQTAGYTDRINPDSSKNLRAVKAEEAMIGILLIHPEYFDELKNKNQLPSPDEFFSGFGKKVYGAMLSIYQSGSFDESMLGEYLSPDEYDRIIGFKTSRKMLTDNTIDLFLECRKTLNNATSSMGQSFNDIIERKRKQSQN